MLFKDSYKEIVDCDSIQERFSEYLDRELAPEIQQKVFEHLRFCELCSRQLEDLCKTISMLHDFKAEPLPKSIQNFRVPRSVFIDFFPTIQQEEPPITVGQWAPYLSAFLFFLLLVSGVLSIENRTVQDKNYNASNYIEVRG